MIDLHTHSFFSDGVLGPMELIRRAEVKGIRYLAITDHADPANLDHIIPRITQAAQAANRHCNIRVIPGVELTHVPPAMIAELSRQARELGAALVVVHGESPVEPVAPGTNRAAIECSVDILAHPGLITAEEVQLAARNGVHLEITARGGHSLGNGRVASLARIHRARLLINTDSHAPGDLIDRAFARVVALGAGLSEAEFEEIMSSAEELAKEKLKTI
ncbi:MAG: histidinol phosphate phosphatase domain-containing protein [Deltaproteobacteria bacterium]|nr:histidinol phosphate phosphatase domain-containing protein [Deltaproteobacteria bacterium]